MNGDSTSRRTPIRSYEDIEAFQRAMKLVRRVHEMVQRFPAHERYDLAAQMRRAAKSVRTNIAEGYGRRSSVKDFRQFLRIAAASANEMEVHLKIARELGYASEDEIEELMDEYRVVAKQLTRLTAVWRSLQPPASSFQHQD